MSPQVTYGPPSGDELDAFVALSNITYLRSAEEGQAWLKRVDPADMRVVRSGSEVAGGMRIWNVGQWFGGRSVPMAGVASVAIAPERRASGLATQMMRAALEEMHAAGTSLSALYPATQPVYRRTGWELAGTWQRLKHPTSAIDARDRTMSIRRAEPADRPLLMDVYTRRARHGSGHLDRTDAYWDSVLGSRSGEDVHAYVVESASGPEGYVVFTQDRDKRWQYDLNCRDLVALTGDAARRLWTFFADHRSFANDVTWSGSLSDPMLFVLREQEWELSRSWTWMLRIVDVRGALSGRGYPTGLEAEIHLEVSDDVCGWNEGRFVLEVSGGEGRVRKGGRGKVRVDVRGLASMFSGFASAGSLRAAGYVDGREGDLAAVSAVFGGPSPWLPDFF